MGDMVYSILNGCGHMWFLPMLFWCFVGGWLLEQIRMTDAWKLLMLVCLNMLALYSLPLRLTSAMSFMVYFYGGYVVYKHSEAIKAWITPKRLLWGWVLFAIVFAVLRPLMDVLVSPGNASMLHKFAILVTRDACRLVYAGMGTMIFYCTAVYYTRRHELKPFTVKLAACCFGIYLFQQFFLQLLYYKTAFPQLIGPYWLPWCGFVVAAVLSYISTDLLLHTKAGRYLIG